MTGDRILVTGASGFIGKQVLACLSNKVEVHAVTRGSEIVAAGNVASYHIDLLDDGGANELMQRVKPTHLMHLAWTTEHGKFWNDPANIDWLTSSIDLLRSFGKCGGKRAIIIGTCAEYAADASSPLNEALSSIAPSSLYGSMKVALYRAALALSATHGFSLAWPRLFHIYGANEARTRLVPSVIRSFLAGTPVQCQNPDLVLDFIDARDLGAALSQLLQSDVSGAINLGAGSGIKIRDLVSWLGERIAGNDASTAPHLQIGSDGSAKSLTPDLHRMIDELKFVPQISLAQGLEDAIAWWRKHEH